MRDTDLVFELYYRLKLKSGVFLMGYTVAMVTYHVEKCYF